MEQANEDGKQQKAQRALERKRASDRIARRVERARTKEYIASLEAQIQVLSQQDSNAEFVQKLLAENRQLTKRIHTFENIVHSAKTILQNFPRTSTSTTSPLEPAADAVRTTEPSYDPNESPQGVTTTGFEEGGRGSQHNVGTIATSPDGNAIDPFQNPIVSPLYHFPWSAVSMTMEARNDASFLNRAQIYRLSAGIPSFHPLHHDLQGDKSVNHTLEDVMRDETLDVFFGDHLPSVNSTLKGFYAGIRDHLANLSPGTILTDLVAGFETADQYSPMPKVQSTNIIELITMSIARETSRAIFEAHKSLRPENRRSPAERIAVFWIVCKFLTWMAFPTLANFSQIPPWYRPTQAQLSIDHPSYIDGLVFPLLREKLVYTHTTYETKKLLDDINSLFTIVWQPEIWVISHDTPLIFTSPDNPWEFELEPTFRAAIWDLRSWRMLPEFLTLYPELATCVHT